MTKRLTGLTMVLGLSLMLPAAVSAQDAADEDVTVPQLDGLAWYRSDDLTGAQIQETLPEVEVADWAVLVDSVGATFDDLEWTYRQAFDPAALPNLGGMATVTVAGADTDALSAAVVADIVTQVERAGFEAPQIETATIAGKEVSVVVMPDGVTVSDAVVYAVGDTVWALVMPEDLSESALEQLP